MTRSLDVLLFDGVNLLDIAGPVQAFEAAVVNGAYAYDCRFVSRDGAPVQASCGLKLSADGPLDTTSQDLLIPGGAGVDAVLDQTATLQVIEQRLAKSGRVISICSGALILAAARGLDGKVATTHWSRAKDTHRFPQVHWDLDRIFTTSAHVYTSAGVTTGIDLALAIIRQDCGNAAALAVARELVVQLRRTGGQSQYATHLAGQFTDDDRLTALIEKIAANPAQDWRLDHLADTAGMNARTLARRFNRHVGMSPAQFVEQMRVDHARNLLADGAALKSVAAKAGFGDLQRMRRAFQRRFGVNVSQYTAIFGDAVP